MLEFFLFVFLFQFYWIIDLISTTCVCEGKEVNWLANYGMNNEWIRQCFHFHWQCGDLWTRLLSITALTKCTTNIYEWLVLLLLLLLLKLCFLNDWWRKMLFSASNWYYNVVLPPLMPTLSSCLPALFFLTGH